MDLKYHSTEAETLDAWAALAGAGLVIVALVIWLPWWVTVGGLFLWWFANREPRK